LGELAAQVAACAAELEEFWEREAAQTSQLVRDLHHRIAGLQLLQHPGRSDPVIAQVLANFARLRRADDESSI